MALTRRLRHLTLTAHVTSTVGWLGAAAAYLALAVGALTSQDPRMVRAAYLAMEPIAWFAIVPLALGSLLTGLVISLGTRWGLFRHHWVVAKFLLTVVALIVLLSHMPTVAFLADVAAETESPDPGGLRGEILHAGGGVLVLLAATVLGVYKPRGLTRYGRRMQRGERTMEHDRDPPPGTPGWVKALGILAVVLVLAFAVLHLAGVAGHH
jgi:hypothetical protein